jgi:hypothetical protein
MPKTTKVSSVKKRPITRSKKAGARKSAAVSKAKPSKRKGLVHHGKRLYRVTPKFVHGMLVGAVIGIVVVSPFSAKQDASALAIAAGKDCDSYSIINCGVTSTADLKDKYGGGSYIRNVFRYFGISAANIDTIGKTAVQGTVFRNGDVKVNGKVVATKATTAARLRVTSRDKKVTVNDATFYTRPLSASWSHDSAPAYVVMKSGIFQFAILAPCGNPIIGEVATAHIVAIPNGTIVSKPAPTPPSTPAPKPPAPTPTPTPLPPKQPVVVQTASSITALPNTGPGAILTIFAISLVCGTLFHKTHHHIKKRRAAKRGTHRHPHHAH